MALQHTPDAMIYSAILPNGDEEKFTFGEFLGWHDSIGDPIKESDWSTLTEWLSAEDNNFGRIGAWVSIKDLREKQPHHPAVLAAKKLFRR